MNHDDLISLIPFGMGYGLATSLGTQISIGLAFFAVGLVIVIWLYKSFKEEYLRQKKLKEAKATEVREVK